MTARARGIIITAGIALLLIVVATNHAIQHHSEMIALYECGQNIHSIHYAIKVYERDTGQTLQNLKQLIPKYLPKLPTCPLTGTDTYSITWEHPIDQNALVYCSDPRHRITAKKPWFSEEITHSWW